MAVVPLLPEDLAEPAELVAAIRARRGGKLIGLDRVMLHSPVVAQGWGAFLGPVRTQLTLDPFQRELAMLAPCAIFDAAMEVRAHGKLLAELGASPEQIAAMDKAGLPEFPKALFTPDQNAIIQFAGEVSHNGKPTKETLEAARAVVGSDQKLVELTTTVAAYNLVARFVATLEVE